MLNGRDEHRLVIESSQLDSAQPRSILVVGKCFRSLQIGLKQNNLIRNEANKTAPLQTIENGKVFGIRAKCVSPTS